MAISSNYTQRTVDLSNPVSTAMTGETSQVSKPDPGSTVQGPVPDAVEAKKPELPQATTAGQAQKVMDGSKPVNAQTSPLFAKTMNVPEQGRTREPLRLPDTEDVRALLTEMRKHVDSALKESPRMPPGVGTLVLENAYNKAVESVSKDQNLEGLVALNRNFMSLYEGIQNGVYLNQDWGAASRCGVEAQRLIDSAQLSRVSGDVAIKSGASTVTRLPDTVQVRELVDELRYRTEAAMKESPLMPPGVGVLVMEIARDKALASLPDPELKAEVANLYNQFAGLHETIQENVYLDRDRGTAAIFAQRARALVGSVEYVSMG